MLHITHIFLYTQSFFCLSPELGRRQKRFSEMWASHPLHFVCKLTTGNTLFQILDLCLQIQTQRKTILLRFEQVQCTITSISIYVVFRTAHFEEKNTCLYFCVFVCSVYVCSARVCRCACVECACSYPLHMLARASFTGSRQTDGVGEISWCSFPHTPTCHLSLDLGHCLRLNRSVTDLVRA